MYMNVCLRVYHHVYLLPTQTRTRSRPLGLRVRGDCEPVTHVGARM